MTTQHPMPMINAPIPSGPVRLWYAATALRLTTSSASPSTIRWMKLPRWLRRSGPRAQSSTEISPTATTADPAIISSLGQVMRTPEIAAHGWPALADHDPDADGGDGHYGSPSLTGKDEAMPHVAGEDQPGSCVRSEGDVAEAVPAQAEDRPGVQQRSGLQRSTESCVDRERRHSESGAGDRGWGRYESRQQQR